MKIKKIEYEYDTNEITIEDLWNDISNTHEILLNENNNQMINLDKEISINSLNGIKNIKRLFKHYVTKDCYQIKVGILDPLYITCDHSLIIKRNNEYIECKPNEMKQGDFLILEEYNVPYNMVSIKKVQRFNNQAVYDLEVDDQSHTFYGNGILLHNSIYVRMDAMLKEVFNKDNIDWNNQKQFSKIRDYVDKTFQNQLNTYCADFICSKFFTDQRRIEFKRQKISAQGEYTAKKHYIVHVYDNEGLPCNKWAYAGVQIKKNELPNTIKKLLKECVQGLIEFNWNNNKFQEKIREMYNIFLTMPIEDISYIKNLGTPKKTQGFLTLEKGAGAHVKAAEFYNQIIKELHIENKYEQIRRFDRFHYFYIKSNNKYGINVIGYKDRWPKEFNDLFEVDREKMFEKAVLAPFKQISINHNYSTFNPNETPILGETGLSIFDL